MRDESMLALAILSILLGAIGQVFLKIGSSQIELSWNKAQALSSIFNLLTNLPIVAGFVLYGLSFILWIKVLSKLDLSYVYPLTSLGYVFILFFSFLFLKENMSLYRGIGILFIIFGGFIVARS